MVQQLATAGSAAGVKFLVALLPFRDRHPQWPVGLQGYGLFYSPIEVTPYITAVLALIDVSSGQLVGESVLYDMYVLDLPYRPTATELAERRREEAETASSAFGSAEAEIEHDTFKIRPNHRFGEYDTVSDEDKAVILESTRKLIAISLQDSLYELGLVDCVDPRLLRGKKSMVKYAGQYLRKDRHPTCG